MPEEVQITPNLDIDPWADLHDEMCGTVPGVVERIGLLANATIQRRSVVEILIRQPDGSHVAAEITWRLFHITHQALAASPLIEMEGL